MILIEISKKRIINLDHALYIDYEKVYVNTRLVESDKRYIFLIDKTKVEITNEDYEHIRKYISE